MKMARPRLTIPQWNAVRALRAIAKEWPDGLWLFAASGTLHVMKSNKDGTRALTPSGGVDADAIVETIHIPCDGGDW